MKVKFWGVRGSVPVPGPTTVQVGGNTPCVEVTTVDREVLILDAGTGIRLLGLDLAERRMERLVAVLLFSHTHWDHIQGLPFFRPARSSANRLVILGPRRLGKTLEQILAGQMVDAYLPFTFEELGADLIIKEVHNEEPLVVGNHTTVMPRRLLHPGGAFGYRIGCQGKSVAYASDTSHPDQGLDPNVVELARGADLLIHDSHFTPEEKLEHPGWGHSSWREAVEVAIQAGARRLALFHHDPGRTDHQLKLIEAEARAIFPGSFVAREGMVVTLQ
ncbi:MAG TPA: MBL fold metallo-hydrolase [Anaerolineae bacterium]|nr:MBL fold metallo-hydrolase [Anaerolineae bacterium]